MKIRNQLILTFLFAAILAACGTQTVQPTLEPATATSTLIPPTETSAPTDVPATLAATAEASIPSTEAPAASVSFANDVMPIFNTTCVKCHGVEQIKEGLDLRTYDALMQGSFNGSVITPGNASDSFLVQQLVEGEMPKRGQKLSASQIQVIIDWVNAGAINN
jgi:mono/diheme cytochrome c family protein